MVAMSSTSANHTPPSPSSRGSLAFAGGRSQRRSTPMVDAAASAPIGSAMAAVSSCRGSVDETNSGMDEPVVSHEKPLVWTCSSVCLAARYAKVLRARAQASVRCGVGTRSQAGLDRKGRRKAPRAHGKLGMVRRRVLLDAKLGRHAARHLEAQVQHRKGGTRH